MPCCTISQLSKDNGTKGKAYQQMAAAIFNYISLILFHIALWCEINT